jgi:hypothetical protein
VTATAARSRLAPAARLPSRRWLARSQQDDGTSAPVSTEAAQPEPSSSSSSASSSGGDPALKKRGGSRQADSTDAVASFLSRRFG